MLTRRISVMMTSVVLLSTVTLFGCGKLNPAGTGGKSTKSAATKKSSSTVAAKPVATPRPVESDTSTKAPTPLATVTPKAQATSTPKPSATPTQLVSASPDAAATGTPSPAATTAPPSSPSPEPSVQTVSFKADVQPLLNGRCAVCHGDKYSGSAAKLASSIDMVIGLTGSGAMPKGGKAFTAEEMQLLKDWKSQGTQDN